MTPPPTSCHSETVKLCPSGLNASAVGGWSVLFSSDGGFGGTNAVTPFPADVFDVSPERFGVSQPVQGQQTGQGTIAATGEAGLDADGRAIPGVRCARFPVAVGRLPLDSLRVASLSTMERPWFFHVPPRP